MTRPRLLRTLDVLLAVSTVLVGCYMAARSQVRGTSFIFPSAAVASAVFVGSAIVLAVVLLLLPRVRRDGFRRTARGLSYAVAVAFITLAAGRIANGAQDFTQWPPSSATAATDRFALLTPEERASWVLRVLSHILASAPGTSPGDLRIPEEWPFPPDVEFAVRSHADTITAWARAPGSPYTCSMIVLGEERVRTPMLDDGIRCATDALPPPGTSFTRARTAPVVAVAPTRNDSLPVGQWSQYRGDASRSGAIAATGAVQRSWRGSIAGEIRSSASAAGGMVLVGAHGTGVLAAFDDATGRVAWRARVPNWIHQDAVSDGRVVAVGFGENYHQIPLRTPAGVAVYDLHTGVPLWTQFEESSVMTSPVINGREIVYISEGGVVRKRELATGRLIASLQLPGSAIMGPPAARGDSLVATLDNNAVCLVLMSALTQSWCRTIPDLRMMGHSAPAILGSRIIVSGHVPLFAGWRAQLATVPLSKTAKLVWDMASGQMTIGGQAFRALALHDGHELWRSKVYAARRLPSGHISGTATGTGDTAVIILPLADTLLSFSAATGAIRWTAPAHGSRGAPLLLRGHIVAAGANGRVEVRDVRTGTLTCAFRAAGGYDRSGPARVRHSIVFASIAGTVDVLHEDDVLRCDVRQLAAVANSLMPEAHDHE